MVDVVVDASVALPQKFTGDTSAQKGSGRSDLVVEPLVSSLSVKDTHLTPDRKPCLREEDRVAARVWGLGDVSTGTPFWKQLEWFKEIVAA